MQLSLSFIRILFFGLCILFATAYAAAEAPFSTYYINIAIGIFSGAAFWCAVVSLDTFFKRFSLRAFNVATIGLLCGYLMGKGILLLFQAVLDLGMTQLSQQASILLSMGVYLTSCYLAMIMTARASDEIHVSIPFIKFKQNTQKKKDLLLDSAALADPRIIDLAASGLLDHLLILPRFLVKECNDQLENVEESLRAKARRCLDTLKKLESIPTLDLRYAESDFSDLKDPMTKLLRLARLLDANILTGDVNRLQQPSVEGIRLVNIHALSSALKPLVQTGEYITIKIQRYGKEPRQGIGYLDDGTMVVVNGGAEFIGENIRAQVLSAKHTTSGRMIFCNALDDGLYLEPALTTPGIAETETSAKNYFAL